MAAFKASTTVVARDKDGQDHAWERLRQNVEQCLEQFHSGDITALAAFQLEHDLKTLFDQAARDVLQDTWQQLEPESKQEAAPRVQCHKHTYRINKRTKATIDTTFGPIELWSFLYLNEEDGEPGLHPLHVRLGISGGVTVALAERVGRWAVDHSQAEVRQLLLREHGLTWSNTRLRAVLREFRRHVARFRQEAQVERLLGWLEQAQRSKGRQQVVLAVGRDGVMVPIRDADFKEASTGTVSVYDRRGRRLGTVYVGQMPEPLQATLSQQLTELLSEVLKRWTGLLPRLAYVTDKGKTQDSYWRKLKRMRHPVDGKPLPWEWVLDFYHVCGYVSKLRESLFGKTRSVGHAWFGRMRVWLRDRRQGVANILRSAMQHYNRCAMTKAAQKEFWKAYRYLRRHSGWMDYARYRRQGLPIGSGVTEAACKTVFTQRLKRSGMSWYPDSGQVIVDLRVLYLSGIWDEVVRRDLQSRPHVKRLEKRSHRPQQAKTFKKAA
jgi:hypothetical protein